MTVQSEPTWTAAGESTSVQTIAEGGEASAVVRYNVKPMDGNGQSTTTLLPERVTCSQGASA